MQYRNVGKAGIKVSEIALGSWMTRLEDTAAVENAAQIVRKAWEAGVNFFDCADAYSGGDAEIFLGRVLKEYPRDEVVVSSKVFFPTGPGANQHGLSRKHILANCERSLKNLGMDYIDLYYCHRFDPTTPMEETLQALSDLVDQGKILYYGVSEEWSAARLERAQRIISERGLHPMTVVQPQYHMLDRYIEHEIVETCERYGIGITPFSPLAQGLLTGKYRKGQPLPAGSRATWQADRQINDLLTEENLDKVEVLRRRAGPCDAGARAGMDSALAGHQLGDCRRQQAQPARIQPGGLGRGAAGGRARRDRPHPRFPPVRAPYRLTIRGANKHGVAQNPFGPHLSGPCGARCRRWYAIWA